MKRQINTIKGFNTLDKKQQYIEDFASSLMKYLKRNKVWSSWEDDNHTIFLSVAFPDVDIQPRICFNISKDDLSYDYDLLDDEVEFIGDQILELS